MKIKYILSILLASLSTASCFAAPAKCTDYVKTCWINRDFVQEVTVGIYDRYPLAAKMDFTYNPFEMSGETNMSGNCVENADGTVTLSFKGQRSSITAQSAGPFLKVLDDRFEFQMSISPRRDQSDLFTAGFRGSRNSLLSRGFRFGNWRPLFFDSRELIKTVEKRTIFHQFKK